MEPVVDNDTVTTDEYGFVVEQAFAKQLRDLVIRERVALYNYATAATIRPLRRQINELCKMLPECPSGYGADASQGLGRVSPGPILHRTDYTQRNPLDCRRSRMPRRRMWFSV